jgi:hypothetical protein
MASLVACDFTDQESAIGFIDDDIQVWMHIVAVDVLFFPSRFTVARTFLLDLGVRVDELRVVLIPAHLGPTIVLGQGLGAGDDRIDVLLIPGGQFQKVHRGHLHEDLSLAVSGPMKHPWSRTKPSRDLVQGGFEEKLQLHTGI